MDHYYKYVRWLSLDIVLGAIFFLAFLSKYYQLELDWSAYFALGAAVWLIYTTDHLMDAKSTKNLLLPRHQFHFRHFKALLFLAGLVLALALINIWFLDERIIRLGAIISAMCIGYLMLVYFVRALWIKEVLVAIVYAIGIFTAPAALRGLEWPDVLLIIQLVIIAFINLLLFSLYDRSEDQQGGFNSLVLRFGESWVRKLIIGFTFLQTFLCLIGFWMELGSVEWMYLSMNLLLWMIFRHPLFFQRQERFRTLGDGIFYLPALFMLFL